MKKPWKFTCPIPGNAEQDPQEGRSSLVAPLLPAAHGAGPWGVPRAPLQVPTRTRSWPGVLMGVTWVWAEASPSDSAMLLINLTQLSFLVERPAIYTMW